MNDEELARNYILNRLPESDRDECERRFLFDPDFEMLVLSLETDLVDDAADGRVGGDALRGDATQALRRRAAQNPNLAFRLRWADAMRRATRAAFDQERKPALLERMRYVLLSHRTALLGGAAALSVVCLLYAGFRLTRAHGDSQSAGQVVPTPYSSSSSATSSAERSAAHGAGSAPKAGNGGEPAQATVRSTVAPAIATFVLFANQRRGEGDLPIVWIPRGATAVHLELTSEEGLGTGPYTATIRNAAGTTVYTAAHLNTAREAGRRYVAIQIDTASFADGDYSVELAGEKVPASNSAFSFPFTLARRP